MGLFSFFEDTGEKLHRAGPVRQKADAQQPRPFPANIRDKEQALERVILDYMAAQNLPIESLTVTYDSTSATVTVSGSAPDQTTREKIVLCCGNVQGVAHVNDQINVANTADSESKWYEVKQGDTLSKIAKDFYTDPKRYSAIFEANKPMPTILPWSDVANTCTALIKCDGRRAGGCLRCSTCGKTPFLSNSCTFPQFRL